jgi:phenylpropionate dioxygenase-like ring-hydroxylating dioxygenase large terminal subunit
VAVAETNRAFADVPFAVKVPDRLPKERYFDEGFFQLEAQRLWPRVWQMACRLEEIPRPRDFAEYRILDQSVIVLRTDDMGVAAFQNACRHRGFKLVEGHGTCERGFVCGFHGWSYGPDGTNLGVTRRSTFAAHNLDPAELNLRPVRCEVWGGCAWVNFDLNAPPLRDCIEPTASTLDAWKVESLRTEWWYACRLPANWKLAQEAFVEQYHVLSSHPQLRIPSRMPPRERSTFDPQAWLAGELQYLRTMNEGMGGMVHATDLEIAEGLAGIELPADPELAITIWHRRLNDEVVRRHLEVGHDVPDLNALAERRIDDPMYYVFPNSVFLPMYSSAIAYRFRPLGPEETLMEVWSLVRSGQGLERPRPTPPEVWCHDDPRWPTILAQDFANIPRQQEGLHARGFSHMRLSEKAEGHIANYHRVIDGFLAGLPYERLLPALRLVNVAPLEMPVADVRFGDGDGLC